MTDHAAELNRIAKLMDTAGYHSSAIVRAAAAHITELEAKLAALDATWHEGGGWAEYGGRVHVILAQSDTPTEETGDKRQAFNELRALKAEYHAEEAKR